MNNLKRFGFVSRELGKKSSLGLLLSMAKQELARTEGILAQVQEIRGLQGHLDRHTEHEQQIKSLKDSQGTRQHKEQASSGYDTEQDVADALEELRKQEATYSQELQAFLQQYKKSGVA